MAEIAVEPPAAQWYKREMGLNDGDFVRIFVRLGGFETVKPGYSLGVMKDSPTNPALQTTVEGVTFYMDYIERQMRIKKDTFIQTMIVSPAVRSI